MATGDPLTGRGEQATNTPASPPAQTGIQAPSGVTTTPPRQPAAPEVERATGMLSQTQMILAVAVLVVLVFVVTFAMNYLGGGQKKPEGGIVEKVPRREVVFESKIFPPDGLTAIDREHRAKGHCDFWFHNPHDAPVKVGLLGQSCKCTEVRLFYLPEDAPRRFAADAVAMLGVSLAGALPVVALQNLAMPEVQKGASEYEILKDKEAVSVPANSVGWVRLVYHGEKPGPMGLTAVVWMENKDTGPRANLDLKLVFHEAVRVKPALQVGTLKEEDLVKGVTRYIYCFSPTRSRIALEATPATTRKGGAAGDPFHVGPPELLSKEETERLLREILSATPDPLEGQPSRQLFSAYRIPVTIKAVSDDGRTPFDLGPFRRRVVISSPEVEGEPMSVVVLGRVLGLIELGTDDDAGNIDFRVFDTRRGKREGMTLSSDVAGLKLEVDGERSSSFLKATLKQLPDNPGRQNWRLTVEVLPGRASGIFPRKEDPLYEDCAVYLKATAPNQKEPRPIRIAVLGTGSGG